ncbi:hypothetical protein BDB00DRAFT_792992 [Zychaea mexicana]|uniref:uncharacterized protein n=1 Tax=Zychaea mexicana TaxID=64656 RepID=UPI0022FE32E9|nr:uncharacterized protein BDB00DRAFT_792992 [Zychaea mexicana]KAI9482616.1 hypothetical protein BDB00DRAFT_792992 [Zychaea mexicana]
MVEKGLVSALDMEFEEYNGVDAGFELEVQQAGQEQQIQNSTGAEVQSSVVFMAAFFAIFQMLYLTNKASSLLLLIFNRIPALNGIGYRSNITPSTVKQQIEYNSLSNSIIRFVVCLTCHAN